MMETDRAFARRQQASYNQILEWARETANGGPDNRARALEEAKRYNEEGWAESWIAETFALAVEEAGERRKKEALAKRAKEITAALDAAAAPLRRAEPKSDPAAAAEPEIKNEPL